MLFVLHRNPLDNESGNVISFADAVSVTSRYEKKSREQKEEIAYDFTLLNENQDELYDGTMQLGSGKANDLYDHIVKKLNEFPVKDDEQRKEKQILLEKMKQCLPNDYEYDANKGKNLDLQEDNQRKKVLGISLMVIQKVTLIMCCVLIVSLIGFAVYSQFSLITKDKIITDLKTELRHEKKKDDQQKSQSEKLNDLQNRLSNLEKNIQKKQKD